VKEAELINKEQFSNYLWLSPIYFISVGVLYLWGYWASFDINIFEYLDLSDVVKVAIIPVGSVFIFTLIGFAIGEFAVSDVLPEGGGKESRVGVFLNRIIPILILLYGILLYVMTFYYVPAKWHILPMLYLFPIYLILKRSGFLHEIKKDTARSLVIMAIVALPLFSFARGKINAQNIINNENYRYAKVQWSDKEMKYLGHVSDYFFFLSKDNQEYVISKDEEVSPLKLHEHSFADDVAPEKKEPKQPLKKDIEDAESPPHS